MYEMSTSAPWFPRRDHLKWFDTLGEVPALRRMWHFSCSSSALISHVVLLNARSWGKRQQKGFTGVMGTPALPAASGVTSVTSESVCSGTLAKLWSVTDTHLPRGVSSTLLPGWSEGPSGTVPTEQTVCNQVKGYLPHESIPSTFYLMQWFNAHQSSAHWHRKDRQWTTPIGLIFRWISTNF